MFTGNSIDHVNQSKGKCFSSNQIRGYYNDLTQKVLKNPRILMSTDLPLLRISNQYVEFPVAIFQYGLGAYDLYLLSSEDKYLNKFWQTVEWSVEHLDTQGRWNNFFFYSPEHPYGAMAQGEGASLLIRAYTLSGEKKYLDLAKKAIDFMLTPIEEGGTTKYDASNCLLMEYTFKGMVLNGAIFAWWGLYDYVVATNDTNLYRKALDSTLNSLVHTLPQFKCTYWSMYSLDRLIASPFYHNLHIAQMEAMFELTNLEIFKDYGMKWRYQQNCLPYKSLAFIRKAFQKILEK